MSKRGRLRKNRTLEIYEMGVELEIKNKCLCWFDMNETSGNLVDSKFGYELATKGTASLVYYGTQIEGVTNAWAVNDDLKIRIPNGDWTMVVWALFQNYAGDLIVPLVAKNFYDIGDGGGNDPEFLLRYIVAAGAESLEISVGGYDYGTTIHPVTPVNIVPSCLLLRWHNASKVLDIQHHTDIANNLMESVIFPYEHVSKPEHPLVMFSVDEEGDDTGNHEMPISQFALFKGILTDAEAKYIYNSGSGIEYENLTEEDAEPEPETCDKSIECCDEDIFAYAADSSEVVSRARDYLGNSPPGDVECPAMVDTTITPTDAVCVRFGTDPDTGLPTLWVAITADDPRAYILYTTDGSNPARDESGTTQRYTGPVALTDPYTTLKYMAVIEGCQSYPIKTASFTDCVGFDFSWLCTLPAEDKVGARGVWVPDTNDDHNWQLAIDLDVVLTRIDRIDILELDEDMQFTTGMAWSTDDVIYPYPEDPTKTYSAFPLWVEESGVPIVNAYTDSIGNYVGAHTWDLFGNIQAVAPTNHFFELILTTEYGVAKFVIQADTCTAPIPTCLTIPITLTPDCAADCSNFWVDIDWTVPGTGAGGTYRVRRINLDTDPTQIIDVDSGAGAVGPMTYRDENLQQDTNYRYVLEYTYASGCISNINWNTKTKSCPQILIETDKAEYNPDENILVSVSSWGFQAGTGTCGADIQVLLNGSPWFTVAPNGLVDTTMDLSAAIDGANLIEATACSECGEMTAEAGFTKRVTTPAGCDITADDYSQMVQVDEFADGTFPDLPFASPYFFSCQTGDAPKWEGIMITDFGGCYWGQTSEGWWQNEDGGRALLTTTIGGPEFIPQAGAVAWWLRVSACVGGDPSNKGVVWQGYKTTGPGGVGTFTFSKNMTVGGTTYTAALDAPATLTVSKYEP